MQTCWRSDKVDFCEINKRNAGMQRSTISMFAQLVQLMGGKIEFHNLVNKYQSDKGAKGLTTWSQFIAMLFCQLTGADSLREISDGLYSSLGKLSHIGATAVCRSTLSYANSKQPYKLYEDFYYVLLEKFRHEIQARTPQAKSYLEPEVCHWSND